MLFFFFHNAGGHRFGIARRSATERLHGTNRGRVWNTGKLSVQLLTRFSDDW